MPQRDRGSRFDIIEAITISDNIDEMFVKLVFSMGIAIHSKIAFRAVLHEDDEERRDIYTSSHKIDWI